MIISVDTRHTSDADVEPVPSPQRLFARGDWWDQAACRVPESSLTQLFFSDELHDIAAAKRMCADCPVLAPCLEGAIARQEPWGVWGGQLFVDGRIVANKRRRGRPPKHPRPEIVVDEVPLPASLGARIA